jgi:DNA primase
MSLIKTSELTGLLDKVLKEAGRLRTGNNLTYHCPICQHRKRKLEVCLDDGYWHCWVCDSKGRSYFSLFKKLKASQSDIAALEKITGKRQFTDAATFFDKPLISFEPPKVEEATQVDLPETFKSLAYNDGTVDYRRAMNYARKRKITATDIVKYNIGYCDKGEYQHRLVFPSYDRNNRPNFFSTRSYFDDTFLKYINSKVSKDIIGFENLIDFDYPIYLCEGALDAISLRRNAIPLFGKTLSNKLKTAIIESKCPEVNIVLDDDALSSALRIGEWVQSIGRTSKIVRLSGKDPNVLGFEKSMMQAKETDNLDFRELMRIRLGV